MKKKHINFEISAEFLSASWADPHLFPWVTSLVAHLERFRVLFGVLQPSGIRDDCLMAVFQQLPPAKWMFHWRQLGHKLLSHQCKWPEAWKTYQQIQDTLWSQAGSSSGAVRGFFSRVSARLFCILSNANYLHTRMFFLYNNYYILIFIKYFIFYWI